MDYEILDECLRLVSQNKEVNYADVRQLSRITEKLTVKNNILIENINESSTGIGIRVLVNNSWGYAATNVLEKSNLEKICLRAIKIAKASSKAQKNPISLAPEKIYNSKWETPLKINPKDISLEEKTNYLIDVTKNSSINDSRLKSISSYYNYWQEHLLLKTSEGTDIDQILTINGGGISSVAVENGVMLKRSSPSSFRGNFASGGYEFFKDLNLIEKGNQASAEVLNLLEAENCPKTTTSVILKPNQMYFQIHETCGHPTELDRVLDYEAAYAGTSFLKPDKLNSEYKFGNDLVNCVADATLPLGVGSFGFDHEGVEAQKVKLIEKGKLTGFMTGRDTATKIGLKRSGGHVRAESWFNTPLIRMTNILLEPGDWDYAEMIEETKSGIIFDTNKSWSIDDLRLDFQFSTEVGWLIENGEIKKMIKNPTYRGITPEFWNNCSAIGKKKYFELYGLNACGKGEPAQIMFAGHGSSPARFDHINVGN